MYRAVFDANGFLSLLLHNDQDFEEPTNFLNFLKTSELFNIQERLAIFLTSKVVDRNREFRCANPAF
jgi:hypothetical protein